MPISKTSFFVLENNYNISNTERVVLMLQKVVLEGINAMHKLIYCEFEQVIGKYYKPINKDDLSKSLLKAGLEETEYGCVDRIDKHQLSKIRRINGGVDVNKDIVEFYYDKKAEERTRKYFQTHILCNIGKSYYLDLINDVAILIQSDKSIDQCQAGEFLELAERAKELIMSAMTIVATDMPGRTARAAKEYEASTAVAEYLAIVLIHCIQHKRETKSIFLSPFHNLMPQNIQFTGRKEVLQELSENFRTGEHIQILSGMPGVGKTQIALQFAYENIQKYDIIWWINAENEATLLEACSVFLQSKDIPTVNNIANRFCNYFEQYDGSWLLIYDNYPIDKQIQLLDAYIPKNIKAGHILMTSRGQNRFHGILPKNIDVFMPDDAIKFIQKNIEVENAIGAEELAKHLGYLPLPLSYSVAYIAQTPHYNCVKYLKLLLDRGAGLFESSNDIKLDNYRWTVRETFMISISKFSEEAKKGDDFMKGVEQFIYASAYFPSYCIDLNFIKTISPEALRPELYKIMNDDVLQDKLVRVLTSCSLYYVVSSSDSESLYGGAILGIHKLLQDVIISQLRPVFPKEWDHFYESFPTVIQAGIMYVESADLPHEIQKDPMYLLTELIFQKCAHIRRSQPYTMPAAYIVIDARMVLRHLKSGILGKIFNEDSWLTSGKNLEELEDYLNMRDSFMLKFMYEYYYYCEIFVKVVLPSCGYLVGIKPLSEYTPAVAEEIVKSIAIAIFSNAVPSYPSPKDFLKNRVLAKCQAAAAQAGNIIITELLDGMDDVKHSQNAPRQEIFIGSTQDIFKRIINIQKIIQTKYFEKGTGLYSILITDLGEKKLCLLSTSPDLDPTGKFELAILYQSLIFQDDQIDIIV